MPPGRTLLLLLVATVLLGGVAMAWLGYWVAVRTDGDTVRLDPTVHLDVDESVCQSGRVRSIPGLASDVEDADRRK